MYSGFITNYICTAKCRHCMYCSTPKVKDEYKYIDSESANKICKMLSDYGIRSMHIGGGEPFMNFNALCNLLAAFKKHRISVDYIETNAYWCSENNQVDVIEKLRILHKYDVDTVMVSVDPFHIEYVPLYKPLLLVKLLRSEGFGYFIWQQQFLNMLSSLDNKKRYSREELEQIFGKNYIRDAVRSYGMGINGRALSIAHEIYPKKRVQEILSSTPCTDMLTAQHFHIDLYGNFIPSGCPGISVELKDYINDNITEEKYPVVSRMRKNGIKSLYQYAVDNGFEASPNGYISKCDLCCHIRTYLSDAKPSYDIAPNCYYDAVKNESIYL
jgi:Predicted Fe-S oxidoreductases